MCSQCFTTTAWSLAAHWEVTGQKLGSPAMSSRCLFFCLTIMLNCIFHTCLWIARNPTSTYKVPVPDIIPELQAPCISTIELCCSKVASYHDSEQVLGLIVFWSPNSGLLSMKIIYLFIYTFNIYSIQSRYKITIIKWNNVP